MRALIWLHDLAISTDHPPTPRSKKQRLASLTQTLEDEKSWQGQGQERMMGLVKEAAQLKGQASRMMGWGVCA